MDKLLASGSCFFGHKWTKYVQYNVVMLSKRDMRTKFEQTFQKRFCVRCNKMEESIV